MRNNYKKIKKKIDIKLIRKTIEVKKDAFIIFCPRLQKIKKVTFY